MHLPMTDQEKMIKLLTIASKTLSTKKNNNLMAQIYFSAVTITDIQPDEEVRPAAQVTFCPLVQ